MIIEKDCDLKIRACNRMNFSSNINEVIRAVLNPFYTKRFSTHQKHQKDQKSQKAQRRNQAKAQNANKRTSDIFPIRCF